MKGTSGGASGREIIGAAALYALIALLFTFPLLIDFGNWGIQDWDASIFFAGSSRLTILRYHQIPLWNPWYCGGTYLFAQPQSRCLSPFHLLDLFLGEVKGFQIQIVIFAALWLLGTYLLARHLGMRRTSAHLAAFVFTLNSAFSLSVASGMSWYLSWMYLPWSFLFFLKAYEDGRYAVWCGIALSLMYFEGGHYPVPMTLAFLALYGFLTIKEHGLRRTLKVLSLAVGVALGVTAIKLLPGLTYLSRFPRAPVALKWYSGYNLRVLIGMLTDREQIWSTYFKYKPLGMTYQMDGNGVYIGILPLLLLIPGVLRRGRRHWPLALCGVVFLWLSFGDQASPSLWKPLRHLPVFDSMRVAQRFVIPSLLCASMFVGMGLQWIVEWIVRRTNHPRFFGAVGPALVFAILLDLAVVDSAVFWDAFPVRPVTTRSEPRFFQTRDYKENITLLKKNDPRYFVSDDLNLYAALLTNVGTIHCQSSEYNGPRAAVPRSNPRYYGEVWVAGNRGTADIVSWSPNRVRVKAFAPQGGHLVLNQNYDTGWKARRLSPNPGRLLVENLRNLAAARIAPGDATVEFYYRPLSFIVGAVVSAASLGVVLVALLRRRPL